MVIFYKKWKKYNEIELTKNKINLNIRKMTNHPSFPEQQESNKIKKWKNVRTEEIMERSKADTKEKRSANGCLFLRGAPRISG